VRFLRKRLDGMVLVDKPPADLQRVFFGAWVTLEDEAGNETRHRIVGPDEFDLAPGYISMDAPLARALLGKRLDDEVTVATPRGDQVRVIVGIGYDTARGSDTARGGGVTSPARS
jgi:transcription elongation factor GreB